jgi:hypothetical protein
LCNWISVRTADIPDHEESNVIGDTVLPDPPLGDTAIPDLTRRDVQIAEDFGEGREDIREDDVGEEDGGS